MTPVVQPIVNGPPASAAIDRGRGGPSRPAWLAAVIATTAIGALALTRADENAIGATGLIGVYPVATYVAVAALLAVFVLQLYRRDEDVVTLGGVTSGLVVLLHGAPAFVESAARFPVAWLHAYFVDYISHTGDLATGVDARFSWPGFFTGASALTEAVGAPSARIWLVWTPTVVVLACIPLLVGIGRATLTSWRATWTGTAIFVLANWVGQEYFAPQSVGLVLYLAILALALSHLRTRGGEGTRRSPSHDPTGTGGLVGRLRQAFSADLDPAELGASATTRIGLVVAVAAGALALAASHQLTPVMLVATLGALAAVGRLRPWPLALFAGVAALAWLCVVAEPFWFGHPSDIFGSLGRVDSIARSGLTERIVGSDTHLRVVQARIRLSILVWALAGAAVMVGVWRRRLSVPLLVLAGAPSIMILAGVYGGEVFLRMYLFSLVGCCLLIGSMVWSERPDHRWRRPWTRPLALWLALVMAVPLFLISRYGNESFERLSAAEVATADALTSVVPHGAAVVSFAPGGMTYATGRLDHKKGRSLLEAALNTTWSLDGLDHAITTVAPGSYVLVLRSQIDYAEQNLALPTMSVAEVTELLMSSGRLRVVFSNDDGTILERIPGS